ncbi:kinesin-like protein KIF18A [Diachasma alloeum]|uniref:kinesin-like protein KIF18A n=1 Tax=Diachasma alloeum TaxID=454923 RepID=UPI00073842D7|nr:kinesin-like protein KIF18A [Diachasma alloeum]
MVLNKRDLEKAFSPGKARRFGKRRSGAQFKPSTSGSTTRSVTSDNEGGTSIKVIVRVRPPNERESQDNHRTVIKVVDEKMLIFDPKVEENPFFYRGVAQKGRDLLKKQNKELQFIFDHVFDMTCSNEQVFDGTTREIISDLLEGYNCSVFAYGATGAGKTHTMLGKEGDPGITYRTMAELFRQIEGQRENRNFTLGVTYLEIYNENVQDLLHKSGPLALREDGRAGVIVANLKIIPIASADELLQLLARGNKNRTQHPTDANQESSRSHAVFQVYVNMASKLDGQVKQVKLSMIDLAGSERASATGCKGARFKEGANINKSLLALGNCINNLADGVKHIPYRDSKLTRLLKDSLGGNCRTVMIANIGPSSMSYEDTYNTLRYANRAKKIKTHIKKNIISCEMHVTSYIKLVDEQKKEINLLKEKLLALESKSMASSSSPEPSELSEEAQREIKEMNDRLNDLYEQKKSLNEKVLSLQSADKILCSRIQYKIAADKRLQNLTAALDLVAEEQNASGKSRVNKSLLHFKRQREVVKIQMEQVWSELQSVERELDALNDEISKKGLTDKLRDNCAVRMMEIKSCRIQQQYEHARKICSLQQCEMESSDTILKTMSGILQTYYGTMCGYNIMTDKMKTEYKQLVKSLEGVRNIKWADADEHSPHEDLYNRTGLTLEELMDPLNNEMPIHNALYLEDEPPAPASKLNTTFDGSTSNMCSPIVESNLNSTITVDSPVSDEPECERDLANGEEIKASQLNNTFNLMENKAKKRILADKNHTTSRTPNKVRKVSPKNRVVSAQQTNHNFTGKENKGSGKPVSVMSAKSVAILNKLKSDRPKLLTQISSAPYEGGNNEHGGLKAIRNRERRGLVNSHPYQKNHIKQKLPSAAPSSRVPW